MRENRDRIRELEAEQMGMARKEWVEKVVDERMLSDKDGLKEGVKGRVLSLKVRGAGEKRVGEEEGTDEKIMEVLKEVKEMKNVYQDVLTELR